MPPIPPLRPGGLDWEAVWRALDQARTAARRLLADVDGHDRWARRAGRFDRRSRLRAADDGLPPALERALSPADTVLDIGAGTGRHVVLFARRCRRVLALEPSPSMRARLHARVADERLDNVEILDGRWPLDDPPEVDVAFSSHVLYGAADPVPFLAAMTGAARRVAALCLGLRAPATALAPLFLRVHGFAMPPHPAALEAFNLLYQLGARPELTLVPGSERPFTFNTSPEDLAELTARLSLAPTAPHVARVRAALAALAPAGPDDLHHLGTTGPNALLLWHTRG